MPKVFFLYFFEVRFRVYFHRHAQINLNYKNSELFKMILKLLRKNIYDVYGTWIQKDLGYIKLTTTKTYNKITYMVIRVLLGKEVQPFFQLDQS